MRRNKEEGRRKNRALGLLLLVLIGVLGGPIRAQQTPPAQPPPSSTAAQEGFVPIGELQPKEEMPAAPLVMAAYAVAWLVIFSYVWSLWKRLQRVETEIADVSKRLATGARR